VITVMTQMTVARWAPGQEPSPEIVQLIRRLSEDPWLMLVWLGPVAWIGAALFEELARVFVLRRLWLAWPGATARSVAVMASALAFGLVHYYQGPPGMVSTGFMGLVAGAVFLFRGRLWPLVLGHAVYDMISIGIGVLQVRGTV
ncbi:MAG: CPBP family intramembrane metalloprotease, partial [Candidatus Krumholzibacteriota bacterium]|nr:CPBP family intramembrane metalloprotease [Candidatus Krumholzibacteriota bacterium]